MLAEIAKWFPKLGRWVQYTYGSHSFLFSGTDNILYSSTGVQQGDPLGPLLFSLVLQVLLEGLREDMGQLTPIIVAYLDDVTLAGPLQAIIKALQFIQKRGPPLGLNMSPTKSVVWAPFLSTPIHDISTDLCQVSYEKGVQLLGGSVAIHPSYIEATALKRVDKFKHSVNMVLKIGDPQLCLQLLRQCVGMPKLNYCWRVSPPNTLLSIAEDCDTTISSALNWIINGSYSRLPENVFDLATLPIALSGLGVDRPSHVLRFAHLAARSDTFCLRRRQFHPFIVSDFIREELQHKFLAQLHISIQQSQLALKLRGGLYLGNQSYQKDFASLHDASKRFHLLEVGKNAKFSPQQQYILTATAKATHSKWNKTISLASQWLTAMPNRGFGQIMDSVEYRAALQFRLLLPQRGGGNKSCDRPNCSQVNDPFGYHQLGCRGKGNGTYQRHNAFAQELCMLAESVGIMARYNAKEGHSSGFSGANSNHYANFRPGDCVFIDPRKPILCIDLTIGSPLTTTRSNKPEGRGPGLLMAQAAAKKHRQYDNAVALHGKDFKVFAVDVAGFTNEEAKHILKQLTGAYCRTQHITYSHAFAIITRRVSFFLMKHLAYQLLRGR